MQKPAVANALYVFCLVLILTFGAQFQQTAGQVRDSESTLHGRVVDAHTGEPLAKVKVIINGTDLSATTDEKGEFTILGVPSGPIDLYITTVNYGLVKKSLVIKSGATVDAQIALSEDAAALTENVSVSVGPYETTSTTSPSEQTLNKGELQSLSSILVGDPVRAAQSLPGAAAGDDFYSEFSVRGAGFDRIGLYLDGVLTENFVHTIQGNYLDTGSLSVVNADTVSSVSLFSGAFPANYGDRTGSILEITTRDGNRVKPAARITAALSGIAGIADGPFAKSRGSYLVAGRKSYVGYLIRRINNTNHFTNNPPILNFADLSGKAIYDLTKRNQIGFSVIYGALQFDRNRDRNLLSINTVFRGNARNLLMSARWSYTPSPHTFWQTRVFGLRTDFTNTNRVDQLLQDGNRLQYGVGSDVTFQARPAHRVEAGLYIRRLATDSLSQSFFTPGFIFNSTRIQRSGTEQAYYALDTLSSERNGLSLTGGVRIEHSALTRQTLFSPRAAIAWSITKEWKLRGGAGRYYQFPNFEQMFGRLGNQALNAERATHYNASIERLFGDRMRVLAEVYDREDRDLFFSLSDFRLVGSNLSLVEFPFANSVRGHARGVEFTLQRRSANKLAGWLSYSYSRTHLTDAVTGLHFVSDTDQRHTVNVYGTYRFTETWNLSGEWRYGSGQPIPGFFRQVGSGYFLAAERNEVRLPYYSRVDVRLSKAFLFSRWKLTATGEVINLLNRTNLRFGGFNGFDAAGRIFGGLDRTLPILPSVGVVIEF